MKNIRQVRDAYEQRIVEYLKEVKDILSSNGIVVGDPHECPDGQEYHWEIECDIQGKEFTVDVMILESCFNDEEVKNGVSFAITVATIYGETIYDYNPYNYSDNAWVVFTDDKALEERWKVFLEGVASDHIYEVINEHF